MRLVGGELVRTGSTACCAALRIVHSATISDSDECELGRGSKLRMA
jgi:hypothetical protein